MEDTVIVWYDRKPLMLHGSIATKFGLSGGSQIQDPALHAQLAEENTQMNRSITGLRPAEDGEFCGSCSG